MSKQSLIYALSCLVIFCLSTGTAFAESDFFQMEREDVRSRLEQLDAEEEAASGQPGATNAATFHGGSNNSTSDSGGTLSGESFSIDNMFNKPSEEEIKAQKRKEGWSDFEDVSGTDAEKNYYNSREMEIRRELSKPLPKKNSFNDEDVYDSLERSVDALGKK